MFTKLWFVISAWLPLLIATCSCLAEDKPQSFSERWQLQFFPEEMPDQRLLLVGTAWLNTGDMNILGSKTDLSIRFPSANPGELTATEPPLLLRDSRRDALPLGTLPVQFSSTHHHDFLDEPIIETNTKYSRSLLAGPCLEYGGRVRTIHVAKDKQLLLNAVVPVNPLQWYTVRVEFSGRPEPQGRPPRDGHFRVTEFLYEFGVDPLQADEGPLTIHYHSRDTGTESTTTTHFHQTFRNEPSPQSIPGVRRVSTGLTPLLFYPEFQVAVTDESHDDLYEAEAFQPLHQKVEELLP